jgi:hypothetical protein
MPELSTDELRAKALEALTTPEEKQEAEPEQKPDEKSDPARDDKGRFVKAEADTEEQEEVVYQRKIDLGDGSGVQVFEGSSLEELVDKLAKAQEHASRKIRELSVAKKEAIQAVEESDELTDDEKFILSQQILKDPAKVIETFVERTINKRIAPKLKEVDEIQRVQRETRASEEFVQNTPDYYTSPKNGKRLLKWLETEGKEATVENLQAAFADLNESGLLETKPAEKQDAESETEKPGARIVRQVETSVIKRKVVGGLPAKRQAQVETKSPEPTEEDLRKMPMDQLRQLTYQHLRQQ